MFLQPIDDYVYEDLYGWSYNKYNKTENSMYNAMISLADFYSSEKLTFSLSFDDLLDQPTSLYHIIVLMHCVKRRLGIIPCHTDKTGYPEAVGIVPENVRHESSHLVNMTAKENSLESLRDLEFRLLGKIAKLLAPITAGRVVLSWHNNEEVLEKLIKDYGINSISFNGFNSLSEFPGMVDVIKKLGERFYSTGDTASNTWNAEAIVYTTQLRTWIKEGGELPVRPDNVFTIPYTRSWAPGQERLSKEAVERGIRIVEELAPIMQQDIFSLASNLGIGRAQAASKEQYEKLKSFEHANRYRANSNESDIVITKKVTAEDLEKMFTKLIGENYIINGHWSSLHDDQLTFLETPVLNIDVWLTKEQAAAAIKEMFDKHGIAIFKFDLEYQNSRLEEFIEAAKEAGVKRMMIGDFSSVATHTANIMCSFTRVMMNVRPRNAGYPTLKKQDYQPSSYI